MPQVSILMPAYIDTPEKVQWLLEAVDSVRQQTLTDWELILIDDNSPKSFDLELPHDSRIRYLETSHNYGPAKARNSAANLARSEALLPLDADDILASKNSLEVLYQAWSENPNRVVYGSLQRLEKTDNGYQPGRMFGLPEYSFVKLLEAKGIMPVTCMHSYESHVAAGGWKAELEAGFEDVEYWIAMGKAGYCGHKISDLVLLYRRHDTSRSFRLRSFNRETEMRNKIKEIHTDVYEGRFPMGCCGRGASYTPPAPSLQNTSLPTTLDQYPADQKEWVEYTGFRSASFNMVGQFTDLTYKVQGRGHKFEVHVNDLPKFRRSGRGADFSIGVAPPDDFIAPQTEIEEEPYRAPEPELAEVVRLDPMAKGESPAGHEAYENGRSEPEPEPIEITSLKPVGGQKGATTSPLAALELSDKVQSVLDMESWTLEQLAEADVNVLKRYPGIGQATAEKIIEQAKGLV